MARPAAQFEQVWMEVERVYKGTAAGVVRLFDTGMCDGPLVELGGRYLMYTSGDPRKGLPLRGCTRSRAVENADEDIAFLELYAAGVAQNSIQVRAHYVADPDGDRAEGESDGDQEQAKEEAGPDYPAAGVTVEISMGDGRRRGETDPRGLVVFRGVEAGKYTVSVTKRGYLPERMRGRLEVKPGGCTEASVALVADLRVGGRLTGADGAPLEGVAVDLEQETGGDSVSWANTYTVQTGKDGRFEFAGVRAGRYHLGVNVLRLPGEEAPFRATWYPGVDSRAKAEAIEVGKGGKQREYALQLGMPLAVREFEVRLEMKGGAEVPEEWEPYVQLVDFRNPLQALIAPKPLKGGGPVRLKLCEGTRYLVVGGLLKSDDPRFSAPMEVIPEQSSGLLRLVLDWGLTEHRAWLYEIRGQDREQRRKERTDSGERPR